MHPRVPLAAGPTAANAYRPVGLGSKVAHAPGTASVRLGGATAHILEGAKAAGASSVVGSHTIQLGQARSGVCVPGPGCARKVGGSRDGSVQQRVGVPGGCHVQGIIPAPWGQNFRISLLHSLALQGRGWLGLLARGSRPTCQPMQHQLHTRDDGSSKADAILHSCLHMCMCSAEKGHRPRQQSYQDCRSAALKANGTPTQDLRW